MIFPRRGGVLRVSARTFFSRRGARRLRVVGPTARRSKGDFPRRRDFAHRSTRGGGPAPSSPRRRAAPVFFSSPRRGAGGREKDAPLGGRGVFLTASRRGEGFLRRNPSPSLESSGFFFGEATRRRGRPLDPHAASPRPRIEGGARAPELSSRAFFFAARDYGGDDAPRDGEDDSFSHTSLAHVAQFFRRGRRASRGRLGPRVRRESPPSLAITSKSRVAPSKQ